MKTLDAYFASIRQLIQDSSDVHIERYEEQILSTDRGNLRIRLRFADQALLEISEAFVLIADELHSLSYRYHYQAASTALVFRYDNTPHHPHISTHPNHKHSGNQVLASMPPSIEQVLEEVLAFRKG